jgi:hypothetical protein
MAFDAVLIFQSFCIRDGYPAACPFADVHPEISVGQMRLIQ